MRTSNRTKSIGKRNLSQPKVAHRSTIESVYHIRKRICTQNERVCAVRATHSDTVPGAGFCCVSLFGTGVGALPYGHPRWLPPTTYTRPGGGGSRTRVPLQLKPNRPARPHYPLPLGTPHGTPLAGRELHTRCGGTSTPHAPTPSHQRARPPAAARPAQAQPKALCWLMPYTRASTFSRGGR